MGQDTRRNDRVHRCLNVYGKGEVQTVENAIAMAIRNGDADNVSEAVTELAAAYTGYDFG